MNSWKLGNSRNSMMWVGVGSLVVGAGASLYGANKQSKAMDKATDTNARLTEEANRMNYQRWLESQGVGPNGEAVNTWLPRWATMSPNIGASAQPRKFKFAGPSAAPAGATPPRVPTSFIMPSTTLAKFAGPKQ